MKKANIDDDIRRGLSVGVVDEHVKETRLRQQKDGKRFHNGRNIFGLNRENNVIIIINLIGI